MQIKTKYSLRQKVWAMHDNKPTSFVIFSSEPIIKQTHDGCSETVIRYRFEDQGRFFYEDDLFESKEALIQSL